MHLCKHRDQILARVPDPARQVLVVRIGQAGHAQDRAISEPTGRAELAILCVVDDQRSAILGREHRYRAVPGLRGQRLDRRGHALPVDQIGGYDVVPVVLAALVPQVVDAFGGT